MIRSTHLSLQQKIGYVFVRVEWSCLFDVFFSPAISERTVHIFVKFFEDFSEAIKVYFLVRFEKGTELIDITWYLSSNTSER